jgi:hypothetical protein
LYFIQTLPFPGLELAVTVPIAGIRQATNAFSAFLFAWNHPSFEISSTMHDSPDANANANANANAK